MAKEARTEGRNEKETVIIGITGASGVIYGLRAVKVLKEYGYNVISIYTKEAEKVAKVECNIDIENFLKEFSKGVYTEEEIEAPPSSSSYIVTTKGMIIIPCSIRTLAEIANGLSYNLVSRTAINFLRVRKRLVLVIRETPLGYIELNNALKVAKAGGIILPASPAFYIKPKNLNDIIDFVVGKALDMLEIEHELYKRWTRVDRTPCDLTF